jgi:hypothetical protein
MIKPMLKPWIITHKGRPASLGHLARLPEAMMQVRDGREEELFIVAPTKARAIEFYLMREGYTWPERPEGVDAMRIAISKAGAAR